MPSNENAQVHYLTCPSCQKKHHPSAPECPFCHKSAQQIEAARQQARDRERNRMRYCYICQELVATPKTYIKGNLLIELVLWLCFLLPGFVYSLWRMTSRYEGCPDCGNPYLSKGGCRAAKTAQ